MGSSRSGSYGLVGNRGGCVVKFIEVKKNGYSKLVNMTHVLHINELATGGCRITFDDKSEIIVDDMLQDIHRKIRDA